MVVNGLWLGENSSLVVVNGLLFVVNGLQLVANVLQLIVFPPPCVLGVQ